MVDEGPGCALAARRECCVVVVLIVLGDCCSLSLYVLLGRVFPWSMNVLRASSSAAVSVVFIYCV